MSLVLTPMKMEAWLRLNGKSSRGLLAIYGSSVLGVLVRQPTTMSLEDHIN